MIVKPVTIYKITLIVRPLFVSTVGLFICSMFDVDAVLLSSTGASFARVGSVTIIILCGFCVGLKDVREDGAFDVCFGVTVV